MELITEHITFINDLMIIDANPETAIDYTKITKEMFRFQTEFNIRLDSNNEIHKILIKHVSNLFEDFASTKGPKTDFLYKYSYKMSEMSNNVIEDLNKNILNQL